ncbi:MAG: hypothetical protein LBV51_03945 [Acholeplasmatales bacterium]|nr:hypothetical protein [Acholeplasmatales bacterium]
MIIKKLYEYYNLDLYKILQSESSNLGINYNELNILSSLLSFYKDKKGFSTSSFCKKINAKKDFVEENINSLLEKQLIHFSINDTIDKVKENIIFDNLFEKLEKIILDKNSLNNYSIDDTHARDIVSNIENFLKRALTSIELLELKEIFNSKKVSYLQIKDSINYLNDKNKLTIFNLRKELLVEKIEGSKKTLSEDEIKKMDSMVKFLKNDK